MLCCIIGLCVGVVESVLAMCTGQTVIAKLIRQNLLVRVELMTKECILNEHK